MTFVTFMEQRPYDRDDSASNSVIDRRRRASLAEVSPYSFIVPRSWECRKGVDLPAFL
jgi:hypothetical protein